MPTRVCCIAICLTAAFAAPAHAQVILTGTTFSENFDGLPNTGSTSLDATAGTVQALPMTQFVGTKVSGTGSTFALVASDGSANSGALYSLGVTGSTDRALGTLASGSTVPAFGVQIVNNTGSAISAVALAGVAEQYRSSTSVANVIDAQFFIGDGTGAVTSSNFLTAAGFTDVDSFDLVGATPVASNGAIPPTSTPISATINAEIAPGSSLFLRFVDVNDAGNDAALGLDDFALVATLAPVPEPATVFGVAAGLLAAGGAVRRRRRQVS